MYIVRNVDTSIPPTTAVPIAILWFAPSPVAMASGRRPRMVDTLVMRIGRRRWSDALLMASILLSPFSCFWFANSTMRIPFFATRPMSMMIPIWLKMFIVMSPKYMKMSAPAMANGTVSMMVNGSLKLSNCAARIR